MTATVIRLAHTPDSDDAFMFYALATGKIPTDERVYRHELADIETLNRRARAGELDVTAVSFHAYAYLADAYLLLPCGGALGDGYGPRLVATLPRPDGLPAALAGRRIAVPGTLTTATLALRLYEPGVEPVPVPFDEVDVAVLKGAVDGGVLIHEGQLSYADRGLELWADLGAWWSEETGLPLPLGGNVARRDLGDQLIGAIARDLRASIAYALEHREEALTYALRYAYYLDRGRADEFVRMYVNHYTLDYGERGRRAVQLLLDRAADAGLVPQRVTAQFADALTSA